MSNIEITKQNGYNFLWIDGHMWMWDLPFEVKIQQDMADQCFGEVLVAGYGLGVVQRLLIDTPGVKRVVTIENNAGVIRACKREFGRLYGQVVCWDFFDFSPSVVKVNHIEEYDCVVGDIWPEIDPSTLPLYKKFKERAECLLKTGGKTLAWGKDYFEYLIEKENAS